MTAPRPLGPTRGLPPALRLRRAIGLPTPQGGGPLVVTEALVGWLPRPAGMGRLVLGGGGGGATLGQRLLATYAPSVRTPRAGEPEPLPPGMLQYLAGHQQLINQNPIALTFERRTRARSGAPGGAYDDWRLDPPEGLGPFVCRTHQNYGRGSTQVSDPLTGSQERDQTWGIIMPADVPLRTTDGEDGNVRVEFLHPVHGRFRLRRLRGLDYSGVLFGWQADLERISGQGPVPPTGTVVTVPRTA